MQSVDGIYLKSLLINTFIKLNEELTGKQAKKILKTKFCHFDAVALLAF